MLWQCLLGGLVFGASTKGALDEYYTYRWSHYLWPEPYLNINKSWPSARHERGMDGASLLPSEHFHA